MRLSDALPPHMRGLSPLRDRERLEGLRRILHGGRLRPFRLVDYQCRAAHRLGEALATPDGVILLLTTDEKHVDPMTWEDQKQARAARLALDVDELIEWLHATAGGRIGHTVALTCRCRPVVRHVLDLDTAVLDIHQRRGRVVLTPG